MTILWTDDSIQQYRSEQEIERRRKALQAEAIFSEKDLRDKMSKDLEKHKKDIEEKQLLEKKKRKIKQSYNSPVSGLET